MKKINIDNDNFCSELFKVFLNFFKKILQNSVFSECTPTGVRVSLLFPLYNMGANSLFLELAFA